MFDLHLLQYVESERQGTSSIWATLKRYSCTHKKPRLSAFMVPSELPRDQRLILSATPRSTPRQARSTRTIKSPRIDHSIAIIPTSNTSIRQHQIHPGNRNIRTRCGGTTLQTRNRIRKFGANSVRERNVFDFEERGTAVPCYAAERRALRNREGGADAGEMEVG